MAALILPRRLTGVPSTPEIDANNALGSLILGGVAYSQGKAHPYRATQDADSAIFATINGGPTAFGGSADEGRIASTSFEEYSFEGGDYSGESSDWTLLALARWLPDGSASAQSVISLRVGSSLASGSPYVALRAHYQDGLYATHRSTSLVSAGFQQPDTSPQSLTPVAVVYRNGQSVEFYCGRRAEYVTATTITGFYGGSSTQSGFGVSGGNGGGRLAFGYYLPSGLAADTIREWVEAPLQLFKQPSPRRIYFDAGATSGGGSGVTGALAATDAGADTATLSGAVAIVGTIAATETGNDTAAFAGDASASVFGAIAAQESGADTAAFSGAVAVTGALEAVEDGNDVAAFAGTAAGPITGTLAASEEGADTAAFSGPVRAQEAATGGWFSLPQPRFRTKTEIDDERRRLGILPPKVAEVVREVAREATAKPAATKAEVRRDFRRELAEAQAQYRAEYLRALYAEIEFQRLLQQQAEEEESVAVLLMALAA